MNPLESTLRSMRLLHLALLISIPMYALAAEFLSPREPRNVQLPLIAFFFLAVADFGIALFFRQRLRAAEDVLRLQPQDPVALGNWKAAIVLSLVICETTALFGFVLRFLGATLWQAAPFYVAGFIVLLLWTPRTDFAR